MLDENLKREVEKNLISLWDNYAIRYFEDFFNRANGTEKYESVYEEQKFLEKRALNPGFLREVQSRMNSNPVLKKHRSLILGYILIQISSILTGSRFDSDATMKKLVDYLENKDTRSHYGSKKDVGKPYDRRQVQTIIKDYYSEFFFQPDEKKRIRDERQSVISSVLSPEEMPFSPFKQDSVNYLRSDREKVLVDHKKIGKIEFNSLLIYLMPEFLEGFLNFRDESIKYLDRISADTEVKKYIEAIFTEGEKRPILFKFYLDMNSIFSLYWFKNRRKQIKKRLLEKEYLLSLKEADFKRVFELHKDIFGTANIGLAMRAADLMHYNEMLKESLILYKSILQTSPPGPLVAAHCHDNLGIVYRELGNYKSMISHLKKALPYFEKLGDLYRQALILKNVGEANYRLGRKERCFKLYEEAKALIDKSDNVGHKIGILLNISISCERINELEKAFYYVAKAQEVEIPNSRSDLLIKIGEKVLELNEKISS